MKICYIIGVLLAGSIILNIYLYSNGDFAVTECVTTEAFSPPVTITTEAAKSYFEQYRDALISPDSITGGVITRAAFDEMLCVDKCNGITYTLARDASGTTGLPEKAVFIILQPAFIEYDTDNRKILSVTPVNDSKYIAGNWCPPSCLVW